MTHQSGSSLIIVLILLAALLVSASALTRSSATATAIAGNVALTQAATQIAEQGVQAAQTYVSGLADPESTADLWYYRAKLGSDSTGLPLNMAWAAQAKAVPVAAANGFAVQYVVERLCAGTMPVGTNASTQCTTASVEQAGSDTVGAPVYTSSTSVFYRATVRVTGPKSLESYVQAIFSK